MGTVVLAARKVRMFEAFHGALEPSSDLGIGSGFCETIAVVKELLSFSWSVLREQQQEPREEQQPASVVVVAAIVPEFCSTSWLARKLRMRPKTAQPIRFLGKPLLNSCGEDLGIGGWGWGWSKRLPRWLGHFF